jgi:pantothenate kinase
MDGFHLDNAILANQGQLAFKGAPQTFDVDGFVALMRRLAAPVAAPVYIPVFDRQADLARNAAQCVDRRHAVLIVEGNYLLLDRPGWRELPDLFHQSIMLDVPMATLEQRLVQRWLDQGLDARQARDRALSNDIPNAMVVQQESTGAHLYYKSVRQ